LTYRRAIAIQFFAISCMVAIVTLLVATTVNNLSARGIPFGLGFLFDRAGFTIAESLLSYDSDDSNAWAIAVGVGNTIYASVITIITSTLLGTVLGIARLSSNPLVSALARVWIETARNTPLLLLLLFVYTIWWTLPDGAGFRLVPGVHISMRGLVVPSLAFDNGVWLFAILALAIVAAARPVRKWIAAISGRAPTYAVKLFLIALFGVALVYVSNPQIGWPTASADGIAGGLTLTPETATILLGLVFYTTGFVAEIVRSGIESVPRGQWEAARALGLSQGHILRRIIIPQMMRVIVPPMTSQFINVVKNSTLAIAVGYSDFMVIMGTLINKTSHAIEGTVIIVVVYLSINLSISLVLNAYNRRVAITER